MESNSTMTQVFMIRADLIFFFFFSISSTRNFKDEKITLIRNYHTWDGIRNDYLFAYFVFFSVLFSWHLEYHVEHTEKCVHMMKLSLDMNIFSLVVDTEITNHASKSLFLFFLVVTLLYLYHRRVKPKLISNVH